MGNNPIAWKSKMQPFVALSSSEAEYIALSLCSAALSFSSHILQDFDIKIDFPITINEDNTEAIFMANNPTIGQQTNHISIKYHHVRELIENKVFFLLSRQTQNTCLTFACPVQRANPAVSMAVNHVIKMLSWKGRRLYSKGHRQCQSCTNKKLP